MRQSTISSLYILVVCCLAYSITVWANDELEKRTAPLFFMSPAARMRQIEQELMSEDYPEPASKKIMMSFPRTGRSGLKTWISTSDIPYSLNYDRDSVDF